MGGDKGLIFLTPDKDLQIHSPLNIKLFFSFQNEPITGPGTVGEKKGKILNWNFNKVQRKEDISSICFIYL